MERNTATTSHSKYHNHPVYAGNQKFASRKEYNRWRELQMMERAGIISDLQFQVKFELIPAQREPDSVGPRGGVKRGKTIESACYYIADFVYHRDGETIVEDTKGVRTDAYKIKRKLMLYRYGIKILET
jgi:hypothetical protein